MVEINLNVDKSIGDKLYREVKELLIEIKRDYEGINLDNDLRELKF